MLDNETTLYDSEKKSYWPYSENVKLQIAHTSDAESTIFRTYPEAGFI